MLEKFQEECPLLFFTLLLAKIYELMTSRTNY